MAALLVGLSIMAVMMTVVMPVWNQAARREKEAELVFRGEQYARAVGLFQRKSGPGVLPPTIDLLVEQRFLRKKYKDPIANDDFAPLFLTAAPQAGVGQPGQPAGPGAAGAGLAGQRGSAFSGAQAGPAPGTPVGAARGGIMGVTSKSKAESIRLYKGRSHYNEWQFIFTPPAQAAGAPGAGAPGVPGQRGRGQGPGQPPGSPFGPGRGDPTGGRGRVPQPSGPGIPSGPGRGNVFSPSEPPSRGR